MENFSNTITRLTFLSAIIFPQATFTYALCQVLKLNELEYFETQCVNVHVYNTVFAGGFSDEKNAGIELIHHGLRTSQGGAVRHSNTPEQWDLVPIISNRQVKCASKTIEATLSYKEYNFDSRVVVTAKAL